MAQWPPPKYAPGAMYNRIILAMFFLFCCPKNTGVEKFWNLPRVQTSYKKQKNSANMEASPQGYLI